MSVSNEEYSGGVERLSVEPIPSKPRRPPATVTPLRATETPAEPSPATIDHSPEIRELRARLGQLELHMPTAVALEARSQTLDKIGATLKSVMLVLAVRLQLLLALIGAFALAIGAMAWQSNAGLYVLCAWCILTILPLCCLEYSGRPRRS